MRNYKCICDNIKNVENYDKALADDFKGWQLHHRLETHDGDGERRIIDITKKELIALNMYYHRPANELIFLTTKEHRYLHMKGKKLGPLSNEHKRKLSEAHKGIYHTEETKKKISEAHKDKHFSEEHKKKLSEANKGKHFRVISKETRRKLSKAGKGKHWFNNGKENKFCYECPESFVSGRLR